jgi:hypothetical protein
MTTPSAFKIVSLSTPSAFEPKQKANPRECGTMILPLNNSLVNTIVYGGIGANSVPPLNLAGICKVVLPNYGALPGIAEQYRIQNVTGCVPGQIITFINENNAAVPKYFSFDFSTIVTNISYSPGVGSGTKVLINTPVAGVWNNAIDQLQYVSNVTIVNGGSGYISTPTVSFNPNNVGTSQATGTAVLTNGSVTSVMITNSGSGYTIAPTVTFAGGTPTVPATGTAVIQPTLIVNGVV